MGVRTISALAGALLLGTNVARAAEPPTTGFPAPEEPAAPAAAPAPVSPAPSAPPPVAVVPAEPVTEPPIPPPPLAPEPQPPKNVSLSIAPLLLLLPVIEVQLEARLGSFGLAVFGGLGQVTVDVSDGEQETLRAYRLGLIALGYPLEKFENLQIGAELLYLHVRSDDLADGSIEGFADGIAAGPLIGYKIIGNTGFTFSVQGGVAYVLIQAEATDGAVTEQEDDEQFLPLLNLNLGWSF